MEHFASWLAATAPSMYVQTHESWIIPLTQTLHIAGIGIVLGSVLVMTLRVLGIAETERSLRQTQDRFGGWLLGALLLLLATGLLLIVGEPARELLAFSFWLKMVLIACAVCLFIWFRRSVHRNEQAWESRIRRPEVRVLVGAAILIWIAIIFLGRFIAYDHVWGSLSGATRS
jgi:Ca2+/Na+ antiporter